MKFDRDEHQVSTGDYKHFGQVEKQSRVRNLSPFEIEQLRQEMVLGAKWMQAELRKRRIEKSEKNF